MDQEALCPKCGSDDLIEWTMNKRVGMECRVCSHTWDPEVRREVQRLTR